MGSEVPGGTNPIFKNMGSGRFPGFQVPTKNFLVFFYNIDYVT